MMATQSTMLGMSAGEFTQKGTMSWPRAAPKGLARVVTAVAATRPRLVNHRSE